ncbi:methionine adenosyltransferase [Metamycoplasma hominis]|uniref:S-adenosylmethionine synthase n=1 Tax=Metamycoplasma hominis TaxID=2098 RepID=A0A6A8PZ64_METHO|nr:methionine adenosyltransferase [Metamycoplasma hominis]AIU34140.1 S-adenosylmethionine synthase [Metamycoplasma hominis ATCC 27545]AYK04749.1 methionine adenosyltransferase [Metamycoplasma hominis]MBD3898969.1 methionine adenosyltransferase [Metamycoplasma hominis]MCF1355068.1 methionine adenosyltransferase [Metamycoplasma hominis]MCZ2781455.1 methionine adenosyltransferase [Metamycoplasma hominis]
MKKLLTSESVGAGHPDKICDQISDAILDSLLTNDPYARVACDVLANNNIIYIGGQITTKAYSDTIKEAWKVLKPLGYDENDFNIINGIAPQSADIALGVNKEEDHELGAGDQGIIFGYATNENEFYMPWPIVLAHELLKRAEFLRRQNQFPYAKSDMKSQVTLEYDDESNKITVKKVLMSIQHAENANLKEFKDFIKKNIVDYVLKEFNFNLDYDLLINPTGRFVIGGPVGDTGLTGRKIIVDTYGGFAHHGGGAFSGKDATKIDRSAAYMARYIAKNLVAAKIADKIEIQLSYAIGLPRPQSIYINSFNSSQYNDEQIADIIEHVFDLSVEQIIKKLDLLKPIYLQTATYGHFGRNDLNLSWEKLDSVDQIKEYVAKKYQN